MATRIIEYSALDGPFNAGPLIPATHQVAVQPALTASGTSAKSVAFNAQTHCVCIDSDEAVHVAFGDDPTATPDDLVVAAGSKEFFAVKAGSKVAVRT